MDAEKLCWCGKPVQKSELESTSVETVYRCPTGHRLPRPTALKQAAGLASFATLGIILGIDIPGQ